MPSQARTAAVPWHRHPWPWLLMLAPLAAVLWGAATLWIAIRYADPLVTDHAWQEGRALERPIPVAGVPASAAAPSGRK